MTPTLLNALRDTAQGSITAVKPVALKALVERGLVACRLTDAGFEALGERQYIVEQWTQTDTKGEWARVPSRAGEPLAFATLEAAERFASQVSVLGEAARAVAMDDSPGAFPVFVFGQRHVQDAATGLRTRLPDFEVSDDAPDTPMLIIQKRSVIGDEIGAWQDTAERRYADYDEAARLAQRLAADSKDGAEYRVTYADAPDLPPVVYGRGGARADLALKTRLEGLP
jgi:hypothetical protein